MHSAFLKSDEKVLITQPRTIKSPTLVVIASSS